MNRRWYAMRDGELLDLWTRAGGLARTARATALASGLGDVRGAPEVPIGDLNRALLRAWLAAFGDLLDCVVSCPACSERLEAGVSVGGILDRGGPAEEPVAIEVEGRPVPLRLPTVGDLDAAAETGSAELARRELARRCVAPAVLPEDEADELVAAVAAGLEAADPHIVVRLDLRCPVCETPFAATVDVGEHLWAAVDSRAQRVLAEVVELAAAYGWTEDEVLRLPRPRRRAYAERAAL